MKKLSLHISPCPNDTFAFDAIINHRLDHDFDLAVEYKDIEELNEGVLAGVPDISKISYSVYPKIADRYLLLESGSALGRGNGQLLVRRAGESGQIRTVATPGLNTTANALLMRYFPGVEVTPMLFSTIAEAVERGVTDAGVLIHEGRFVYERRNLELVADLGKLWEEETALPLPLGAIVIKRDWTMLCGSSLSSCLPILCAMPLPIVMFLAHSLRSTRKSWMMMSLTSISHYLSINTPFRWVKRAQKRL